jgi:hypothetical protein
MLLDMAEHNIRDYRSVNDALSKYYFNIKARKTRQSE